MHLTCIVSSKQQYQGIPEAVDWYRYTRARIRRANALLQLGQPAAALEDALMVSNNEPGHINALRLEVIIPAVLSSTI